MPSEPATCQHCGHIHSDPYTTMAIVRRPARHQRGTNEYICADALACADRWQTRQSAPVPSLTETQARLRAEWQAKKAAWDAAQMTRQEAVR